MSATVLLYVIAVVHTEPSARLARRAPRPWMVWTFLFAACAHALGGAAVAAFWPVTELRFEDPDPGGMRYVPLWENQLSALEAGSWVVLYAAGSAVWAVLAGWLARMVWGAVPPDQHLIRIRKRPPESASPPA